MIKSPSWLPVIGAGMRTQPRITYHWPAATGIGGVRTQKGAVSTSAGGFRGSAGELDKRRLHAPSAVRWESARLTSAPDGHSVRFPNRRGASAESLPCRRPAIGWAPRPAALSSADTSQCCGNVTKFADNGLAIGELSSSEAFSQWARAKSRKERAARSVSCMAAAKLRDASDVVAERKCSRALLSHSPDFFTGCPSFANSLSVLATRSSLYSTSSRSIAASLGPTAGAVASVRRRRVRRSEAPASSCQIPRS